ncbi:MAG TPA: hypothetical protein EYO73_11250 [Sulfurimonas sp.]|nr:hypothetical protein [Sulfurimonas sp.]
MKKTILVTIIFIILNSGCSLFNSTRIPPLQIPIDLSTKGNIAETEFRIGEDGWSYDISFDFITKKYIIDQGKSYKTMFRLIEGTSINNFPNKKIDEGIIIPIRVSLFIKNKEDNVLFLEKLYITKGATSWGSDFIERDILNTPLKKGKYLIRVESQKEISRLKDIKVLVVLRKF